MEDLIHHIKRLYDQAKDPMDNIWAWCKGGRTKRDRYRRFKAAQIWAQGNRDHSSGDKREMWNQRRKAYRRQKRRILRRIKDAQKPPPVHVGCGSAGPPDWSGAASICEREVVPVFERRGVPITSRKRTVTLGNPSSDHYTANTTAYAVDAGTYSGADDAHAVAQALGIGGYSTGNYNSYYIRRCDKSFRVQILWAVEGHFNHVHVGVRLA